MAGGNISFISFPNFGGRQIWLNFHHSLLWQRDKQFGTHCNTHLKQEDFDLVADLVRFLRPFSNLTLQVSTGALACVAKFVVMIDQIKAILSTVISNEDDPPALQNTCRAGLGITNKYYSLTDFSPIYRIVMGEFLWQLQNLSLEFKLIKTLFWNFSAPSIF